MTPVLLRLSIKISNHRRVLRFNVGLLPAVQLDDNLARAVVIDLLELANVTLKIISMLRKIKRITSGK